MFAFEKSSRFVEVQGQFYDEKCSQSYSTTFTDYPRVKSHLCFHDNQTSFVEISMGLLYGADVQTVIPSFL